MGGKRQVRVVSENGVPAGILEAIALLAVFFYGVVGADKFLLLSPLVVVGYATLSVWMLKVAFSRQSASVAPPAFFPFLLFVAYGAIVGIGCTIPYEAKIRMLFIGLFVGAYYLWGNSLALFRRSRMVLGWLILFALLASFYGLVNHFKNPLEVLWVERYAPYIGRLASTYICPNHFAHLLQMLLPFCLVLVFISQAGVFLRILSGYSFIMFLPTLFLTESRAGWLGSIAAVGTTVCLLALRRSKLLFILLVVLIPLGSFLLLLGGWNFSETFQRRMKPVVAFIENAGENGLESEFRDFRPQTWLDTLDMVKEKPVTGFGPGSYRYLFPEHRNRYKGVRAVTGHPHNEYLEITAEYGLIGFGLFALAWCYGLIRLLIFALKTQNQHHAFMAIAFLGTAMGTMIHSFFDFEMHVFQNALIFALLAAIAVGPLCGRRQEVLLKEEDPGFQGIWLRGIRIALSLLAVVGLLLSIQIFSSAFLRAEADRLVESRKPELAKRYYQRAIRIDPANWRAYRGMGSIYFKERYYSLDRKEKRELAQIERDSFAKGYAHNPKDATLVSAYGMATIFLGDTETGIELLHQAAQLRPFNDNHWWALGCELRKVGRFEEALEVFKKAKTIRNTPSIRANIQWLERQMKPSVPTVQKKQSVESTLLKRPEKIIPIEDLYKLMGNP